MRQVENSKKNNEKALDRARPVQQFAGYRDEVHFQMTTAPPRVVVTAADGRACLCGVDTGR
jgi:hypothetical protein